MQDSDYTWVGPSCLMVLLFIVLITSMIVAHSTGCLVSPSNHQVNSVLDDDDDDINVFPLIP